MTNDEFRDRAAYIAALSVLSAAMVLLMLFLFTLAVMKIAGAY